MTTPLDRPAIAGSVTFKLVLAFFVAMPLTATILTFAVLFFYEAISTGDLLMSPAQIVPVLVIYSLPIALFVAPVAFFLYRRTVGRVPATPGFLAGHGFLLGTCVPIAVAIVSAFLAIVFDAFSVVAVPAMFFSAAGAIIGPVVALIFGPILRRIDPRYR